ncbi:Siderochrome iron transporter 2 [Exophiala dermatitidis]
MGFLSKFKGSGAQSTGNTVSEPSAVDKEGGPLPSDSYSSSDDVSLPELQEKEILQNPDRPTEYAQDGLKKAEAVALVWPRWAVYATYGWIWVAFFMLALQQGTTSIFNARAYAEFVTAPQITTANMLSSVIGGVVKLPIAKVLNIWGRAEGFFVFVCVYLIGMIVIAASTGPNGYAAGYVLYWIGYYSVYLIMDVFVADTSGLRNRAFAFAFVGTPFICTAFTAPKLGQAFLSATTWRWGYGAFVIIMFFIFMPLVVVFKYYQMKAEKMGLYKRASSGRTTVQSLVHYFHEFDIIGCCLLIAAFVLILLPFTLKTYGKTQYHSASFIVMVIIGGLLFPAFAIWEKYFARTHFIRWELFRQRTVLGACFLSAILYFSFYSWDLYFYNFVLVVYDLSISDAGYMTQIYNVGSTFWGVVFGIWIRYTKRFKFTCLCFGLPLMFLGAGLMIYFRGNDHGIGYLVMCQIFIAFAGGTLVIGEDMAVMASADRDGVPMMLSLIGLMSSVGGAIGDAVAAAIYNNTFPQALRKALPADAQGDWMTIYNGGYLTQMTYPVGGPIRNAINHAWGESQKYGAISATCILVLAIPSIAIWKNHNVDKKQNKGNVL